MRKAKAYLELNLARDKNSKFLQLYQQQKKDYGKFVLQYLLVEEDFGNLRP